MMEAEVVVEYHQNPNQFHTPVNYTLVNYHNLLAEVVVEFPQNHR